MTGRYQYTGPKGDVVIVTYTADQNGYSPNVEIGLFSRPIPEVGAPVIASLVG